MKIDSTILHNIMKKVVSVYIEDSLMSLARRVRTDEGVTLSHLIQQGLTAELKKYRVAKESNGVHELSGLISSKYVIGFINPNSQ